MNRYIYRCQPSASRPQPVYDGDTVRVDIDLGCCVWLRDEAIRLYGINAPELRGSERSEGLISAAALRDWIDLAVNTDGAELWIRTHKDRKGKYGRWLGELLIQPTEPGHPNHHKLGVSGQQYTDSLVRIDLTVLLSLNQLMLNTGLATPYG